MPERKLFHHMTDAELRAFAVEHLPVVNKARASYRRYEKDEMKAVEAVGFAELMQVLRDSTPGRAWTNLTVDKFMRCLKWIEASDDEYFDAMEAAEDEDQG